MEELLPFEEVKRELIIRKEATTNTNNGCYPENRPVETLLNFGVINLNKPSGPTSHQVADYVKKMLNLDKVGHGGTLDPGINGVVPIALGKGTRVVQRSEERRVGKECRSR